MYFGSEEATADRSFGSLTQHDSCQKGQLQEFALTVLIGFISDSRSDNTVLHKTELSALTGVWKIMMPQ